MRRLCVDQERADLKCVLILIARLRRTEMHFISAAIRTLFVPAPAVKAAAANAENTQPRSDKIQTISKVSNRSMQAGGEFSPTNLYIDCAYESALSSQW